jgi:molybdopterin molybdotransferase
VSAFLGQWGLQPEQVRAGAAETAIEAAIAGPRSADLLLVSGGASVGEQDFTRSLFERLGFRVHLCGTNTRPGKPLIFATRGDAVAFGLPGNPLAHFVGLNLFVRAALEKLAGLPEKRVFNPGVLAEDLKSDGHPRETLWPARLRFANGPCELTPLRWSSSGDLTCLAAANALMRVPPRCRLLPAGSPVLFALT